MAYPCAATHPDGDIEIICTGLRPGEAYEEHIDAEPSPLPIRLSIGARNGRYPHESGRIGCHRQHRSSDVEQRLRFWLSWCRSGEGVRPEGTLVVVYPLRDRS